MLPPGDVRSRALDTLGEYRREPGRAHLVGPLARSGMTDSYWSEGPGPGATLHRLCVSPSACFAFALVVRAILIALYPDPAYPDSYYYVDVARALHAGQGFNVDFIWTFVETGGDLPADPHLPIPSNAHWMPLASLIQLPFMAVLGTAAWVSDIPFALIGATAAPLTWFIARDMGARPSIAIGASLMTAVPAATTVFFGQPDNFSLYEPLGAAAIWMGTRALRGDRSGDAHRRSARRARLARPQRRDPHRRRPRPRVPVGPLAGLALDARPRAGDPWWGAIASFVLFLVVVGPWWLRQLAVFGSISPSSSNGKILFIRTVTEMNSIDTPATLQYFLGQGIGPLLASRILGFIAAIGNYSIIVLSFVLTPFLLIGGWMRAAVGPLPGRSSSTPPSCSPFSALLFAVHVPLGTFLHSAVALIPAHLHPRPRGRGGLRRLDRRPAARSGRRPRPPGSS